MTLQRMDHVGFVVQDLAAAIDFFVELGLELQDEWSVEGGWVGLRTTGARGPDGIIVEPAERLS